MRNKKHRKNFKKLWYACMHVFNLDRIISRESEIEDDDVERAYLYRFSSENSSGINTFKGKYDYAVIVKFVVMEKS